MVMHGLRKKKRPIFVSFSGIDGSGKTTQIESLCTQMKSRGLCVVLIRFWDDIAKLTQIRETAGHTLFKGDKGVGTPLSPVSRRDKNVRSWLMTWVRLIIYCIDSISTRIVVNKALCTAVDLIICDRYIYDELANLTLHNPVVRFYIRLVMKVVPKPDISYVLDADPVKARARKPEYPLEFLYTNRQSYLELSDLIGGMTIIDPMPVHEVASVVLQCALAELSFRTSQRKSNDDIAPRDNDLARLDKPQTHPAAS
jgi:thymidylate kinase